MQINLKIWRQENAESKGQLESYTVADANPNMSFIELLDTLNEQLIIKGENPVAFDSDCGEGICGSCGMMINGVAHGEQKQTAVCQLHLRSFNDGDTLTIEPWRAKAFPIVKDLVVDRSAFDRIVAAGGYVSVNTGAAPDANSLPIPKENSDRAFDYAACIGCGACVAACPNASASLFTAAKVSHLALLPQGAPERKQRVLDMTAQMANEGFGDCSNYGECTAVCPKGVPLDAISSMRKEYIKAIF